VLLTTPVLAIELYRAKEGTVAYKQLSKDSPIIYRFQPGEEFKVMGKEKGGWLKVRFSNRVFGYVKEVEATSFAGQVRESEEHKYMRRPVSLGTWARWEGLAVSVERYEVVHKCRGLTGGYGKGPSEGAKLVYIWVTVRNISDKVIEEMPSFYVELSGVEKNANWFGGTVCRYDNETLGNTCYKRLYPGVACEGWKLLEVPERMQMEGRLVTVSAHRWMKGTPQVGQWRLRE